ncbi:MAG: DUF2804 domain-containing protein [Bacilli bacterium]|nr:DUF2804 domain-containing protein [Bacilli bacterium]
MQHKISKGPLLDEHGNLVEAGYSFSLDKEYSRKAIKGLKGRIKEWDYYYIGDEEYGIALTIDDNSYMGLVSVSVLDYKNKTDVTKSYMEWLTFGTTNLPSTSKDGDLQKESRKFNMYFKNNNGKRSLICSMKNVSKGKDFECQISLRETTDKSMVIVTPFEKKRHFYYNQKINLLSGSGYFKYGDITHQFKKDKTLGVLDWGRGVWTYSNTWYWSSLNAYTKDGHRIGFNLGYGFGDTSQASENMFFFDSKAYKLEDVEFLIPKDSEGKHQFKEQWQFKSQSGDINLTFDPIIDRYSNTNALIIQSNQHQVFGYFNGEITVEGKAYKIENLLGFAEMVKNRW